MKYLAVLGLVFLTGCSMLNDTLTGMNRVTGEIVTFQTNGVHDTITATIEGETYKGKIACDVATIDDDSLGYTYVIGNQRRAVLFGDKGHTMRCDLMGGVGTCTTSDGKVFDVQ